MPIDPHSPSLIFVNALQGKPPTKKLLAAIDPAWTEPIQAAVDATPTNRRAALVLATSGVANLDRLTAVLRGEPEPEDRPWPEPTPFGSPRLPTFPDRALPG